jgi:hypothetical protein
MTVLYLGVLLYGRSIWEKGHFIRIERLRFACAGFMLNLTRGVRGGGGDI